MSETTHTSISIPETLTPSFITGHHDTLLHFLQDRFESRITLSDNEIVLEGDEDEVRALTSIFAELMHRAREGHALDVDQLARIVEVALEDFKALDSFQDDIVLTYKGRIIRPKTTGQKRYLASIRSRTITFGLGPAGTGKTYLAMAMALRALASKAVSRIVLTRPIVEAGENLGFLPGTLTEKVDPYIQPLYDALFSMMDAEKARHLIDVNTIEICPLAFMRGRTLSDAFIILDEAQNATAEQIKMFLTRLGEVSKMVVTGDTTQSDLVIGPVGINSARTVLADIDDIGFVDLTSKDVVRNTLVSAIIAAYERAGK